MCRTQGPKRPPGWSDGAKKWNHGAPLSKETKNAKSKKMKDKLTTVPLPATADEVVDAGMASFFANAGTVNAGDNPSG